MLPEATSLMILQSSFDLIKIPIKLPVHMHVLILANFYLVYFISNIKKYTADQQANQMFQSSTVTIESFQQYSKRQKIA